MLELEVFEMFEHDLEYNLSHLIKKLELIDQKIGSIDKDLKEAIREAVIIKVRDKEQIKIVIEEMMGKFLYFKQVKKIVYMNSKKKFLNIYMILNKN